MGLESATFISQLVATNPTGADIKSQGDDHLRLLKAVLQAQFPNLGAAAMTATAAELNAMTGSGITLAALQKLVAITASAANINSVAGNATALANLLSYLPNINGSTTVTDETLTSLQTNLAAILASLSFSAFFPNVNGNVGAADEDLAALGDGTGSIVYGTNFRATPTFTPTLRRGVDGTCHFAGVFDLTGSVPSPLLTLPAGYRPLHDIYPVAWYANPSLADGVCRMIIGANGVLNLQSSTTPGADQSSGFTLFMNTVFSTR